MERIEVLLPSRGRPQRLAQMLESVFATAAQPALVTVRVRLDEDDAFLTEYQTMRGAWGGVAYSVGRKEFVPQLVGELTRQASAPLIYQASDDLLFRSRGWDDKGRGLLRRWPDGMFVAYTNDGHGMRPKCTHFFHGRAWSEVVGYEGWTTLKHFALDQWHEEVANAAGRLLYLQDVVMEHMHKKYRSADGKPKAADDASYQSKRIQNWSAEDMTRFMQLEHVRRGQAERARAAIAAASA